MERGQIQVLFVTMFEEGSFGYAYHTNQRCDMTRIITYSLKVDSLNSDEYYRTITSFADSWLIQTTPQVIDLISGFREYHQVHNQTDRSDSEYVFELLALGVHIHEHGNEASHMPKWMGYLMGRLVSIQNSKPQLEKVIKALRGWLGWFTNQVSGGKGRVDSVSHLINWLRANDETMKAERFEEWYAYFKSKGNPYTPNAISRCLKLTEEFAATSLDVLGKYTENVEDFLEKEVPKHRHRYDARLLSRTRLEYHLGMIGTEILSRAYRQRFIAAKHKMVIVPPCMCAPAERCKAIETPFGAKCQACTPGCRVNQITKLGEKRGFSVTMIPDDVKVFGSGKDNGDVGLVGVACVLTNWNGGWDAGTAGIPAQGLLLDYVGCNRHWDKVGIPTDTNLKKLQEILNI